MQSVQDIIKGLHPIKIHKSQIILDIRLGSHGLTAKKIGNSYVIADDVAKKYIATRKKLYAKKTSTK